MKKNALADKFKELYSVSFIKLQFCKKIFFLNLSSGRNFYLYIYAYNLTRLKKINACATLMV